MDNLTASIPNSLPALASEEQRILSTIELLFSDQSPDIANLPGAILKRPTPLRALMENLQTDDSIQRSSLQNPGDGPNLVREAVHKKTPSIMPQHNGQQPILPALAQQNFVVQPSSQNAVFLQNYVLVLPPVVQSSIGVRPMEVQPASADQPKYDIDIKTDVDSDKERVMTQCKVEPSATSSTAQATGSDGAITVTDGNVLQLWRTLGEWKGFTSDSDIARFLLSLYFNPKFAESQSDKKCVHCSTPLVMCCLTCLLSAKRPSHSQSSFSDKPLLHLSPHVAQTRGRPRRSQEPPTSVNEMADNSCGNDSEENAEGWTSGSLGNVETHKDASSHSQTRSQWNMNKTPVPVMLSRCDSLSTANQSINLNEKTSYTACEQQARRQGVCSVTTEKGEREKYPQDHLKVELSQSDTEPEQKGPDPGSLQVLASNKPRHRLRLADHRKTHGDQAPRPFPCSMCSKHFQTKANLYAHEQLHGPKKFQCETCGQYFHRATELKRHRATRHMGQVFECKECGKRLMAKLSLKKHILHVHRKIKPYLCSVCGISYTCPKALKEHVRSHTDERPYQCPYCPSKFARNECWKLHVRTHTGERPYGCDDCGQRFISQINLTVHRKSRHSDSTFPCSVCEKTFPLQSSLDFHCYNVHGGDNPTLVTT